MNFQSLYFVIFKMKYLLNRMQHNTLSQQMWWLDGKDVCFHPEGQGIKPHKCCVCGQ
jgi:hypothetical protein